MIVMIGYCHLNLWIEISDNNGNMMKLVLIWHICYSRLWIENKLMFLLMVRLPIKWTV